MKNFFLLILISFIINNISYSQKTCDCDWRSRFHKELLSTNSLVAPSLVNFIETTMENNCIILGDNLYGMADNLIGTTFIGTMTSAGWTTKEINEGEQRISSIQSPNGKELIAFIPFNDGNSLIIYCATIDEVLSNLKNVENELKDNETVFYYDTNWKKSSKTEAIYYRIVGYDSENKPVGKIRDYYMSGEIQGISEGARYISEMDDQYSIFEGQITSYDKKGKIVGETYREKADPSAEPLRVLVTERTAANMDGGDELIWKSTRYPGDYVNRGYWLYEGKPFTGVGYERFLVRGKPDGLIERETTYLNGKVEGLYRFYYQNGQLRSEGNKKNGKEDGFWKHWWEDDGKLSEEVIYKDGVIISQKYCSLGECETIK